jgi:hypothetical protein
MADHSKSGQKSGMVKTSLDHFINKSHNKYFIHAKTFQASEFKIRTKKPSGLSPFENRIVPISEVDCMYYYVFKHLTSRVE